MSYDRENTWRVMVCPNHGGLIETADTNYCAWCGQRGEPFIVERVRPVDENATGKVSNAHGATARAAAKDVKPRTGTQRYEVLRHIVGQGNYGATRDEIAQWMRKSPNTIRPRVKELLDTKYVTVIPVTRLSLAGHPSEVLVATAKGILTIEGVNPTR